MKYSVSQKPNSLKPKYQIRQIPNTCSSPRRTSRGMVVKPPFFHSSNVTFPSLNDPDDNGDDDDNDDDNDGNIIIFATNL